MVSGERCGEGEWRGGCGCCGILVEGRAI